MDENMERQIEQELRQTQDELSSYLDESVSYANEETIHYIQQELADVNRALYKIQRGLYGTCEHSGQPLPFSLLQVIPTARTVDELNVIQYFHR